jgi:cytochrome c5
MMTLLHNFRAAFLAVALLGGCASQSVPQSPSSDDEDTGDDDGDDDSTTTKRDAGKKDAGKKDAGKKDAGSSGDDDEGDDEGDDDDEPLDAGKKDAGKSDAGRDAGRSDGGASDAGGDAGRSDAGSSVACANLTYAAFGKNFVDSYCNLCHATASTANGGVALNSLANITTRKAQVKAAVLDGVMPPTGALAAPSDVERERLGAWIDCGPR